MMKAHILLAFVFISGMQVAHFATSVCQSYVQPLDWFYPASFSGNWFEYEYIQSSARVPGKCSFFQYERLDDNRMTSFNRMEYPSSVENATLTRDDHRGHYKLTYSIPEGKPDNTDYIILDTNWSDWAIIYTCYKTEGNSNGDSGFILTRKINPSKEVLDEVHSALGKKGFPAVILVPVDHTDCLPVPTTYPA